MRILMAVVLCMMLACALSSWAQEPFAVSAPTPFAGKPELTVMPGQRASVRWAVPSPDGQWLAAVGAGETRVLIWELNTGRLLRILEGPRKEITALAFSSDSLHVAAGAADGTLVIWSAPTGVVEQTLNRHTDRINTLVFSPDSAWLASGSDDKTVILWHTATGTVEQMIAEHTAGVSALAFSADSRWLASGGLDRRVVVWNLTEGQLGQPLPDVKNPVAALAFRPDGKALAVANGPNLGGAERRFAPCEVAQLELAGGVAGRSLPGIGTGYLVITYSLDGKQLLTASGEKTLVAWDATTGIEKQVGVGQVFLPGLTRALTWERDGVLKLWQPMASKHLLSFVGLNGGAAWLRAVPQGYYDGSTGADALAAWRFGTNTVPCDRFAGRFNKPDLVKAALAGQDLSREPVLTGTSLPPNIALVTPKGDQEVKGQEIDVKIQAAGMKPLSRLEVTLTGRPVPLEFVKTVAVEKPDTLKDTFELQLRLPISNTSFRLRAVVVDSDNMASAPVEAVLYAPGAQPFADKLHVLSIGVSRYRLPGIPGQRYADVDARAVGALCVDELGRGFTAVRARTLVNEEATADAIQAALRELKENVGPNDVVLLYLAAPRVRDTGGNPYMAPFDVDPTDPRRTAVDWRDIAATLNGLRTPRVVLFADIGRTGDKATGDNQKWAFFAGKPDEALMSRGDWGHGAFASALLDALRGRADVTEPVGVLTVSEISDFVGKRVAELSDDRQHPMWGAPDTRLQGSTLAWLLLPDLTKITPAELTAILDNGEVTLTRRDPVGRTLLHWAVTAQRLDLIDLLLERKADPNAVDTSGYTPLHLAASLGAKAAAEKLLAQQADLNVRDKAGRSAFDIARQFDQNAMMDFFLPAAPASFRDEAGRTPLHLAVFYGRTAVVQTLLERKADPLARDQDGRTPLHLAAMVDQPEIAVLLLGRGANAVAPDNEGLTPLHLAVRENQPRMVTFLLGRLTAINISAQDKNMRTPVHLAVLEDNAAMLDLLAKSGANMSKPDAEGLTPLMLAVKEQKAAAARALLARPYDINARDKFLYTALHWAVSLEDPQYAALLIAARCNLNAQDRDGNTPLHIAAWLNRDAIAAQLIAAGAQVNVKNAKGETPLKMATLNESKEMVELLRKSGGFE